MKKEITRESYVRMVFGLIGIGVLLTTIFYWYGSKQGFNPLLAGLMGLSEMIIGYGIGLSVAYSFNIKDKKEVK
jgi:hypothetical protein